MRKFLLIFVFLFFATPVFAGNDLLITCSDTSCSKSSNLPFFNESSLTPGFSHQQILKVINNRSDNCHILFKLNNLSPKNLLSLTLMLAVSNDNTLWYSGSLNDLADNNNHQLGNIDSNQYKDYQWLFSLNQSVDNNYQQLSNSFDLDFNFTCGEEDNSSSDNLCHDIAPTQNPQNLKAISGKNSVTLFWDEPTDNFTYYLIAYSTNDTAATYGNPNVGSRGTKSYLINNLSAGTTYYFKIRTGNGCAPGLFSNIVSAIPKGKILTDTTLSPGFQPNVLGVQNTETIFKNINSTPKNTCLSIFPFTFILALVINLILYRYPFIVFIISLFAFLFDYYTTRFTCVKHPYFYFANLVSFLLPLIISFWKKKN
ncbi:MAG: fibronectin type III domain-containing protein [Candidatus Shapirobacteria bacterium]|jgi:hypothetical protein